MRESVTHCVKSTAEHLKRGAQRVRSSIEHVVVGSSLRRARRSALALAAMAPLAACGTAEAVGEVGGALGGAALGGLSTAVEVGAGGVGALVEIGATSGVQLTYYGGRTAVETVASISGSSAELAALGVTLTTTGLLVMSEATTTLAELVLTDRDLALYVVQIACAHLGIPMPAVVGLLQRHFAYYNQALELYALVQHGDILLEDARTLSRQQAAHLPAQTAER